VLVDAVQLRLICVIPAETADKLVGAVGGVPPATGVRNATICMIQSPLEVSGELDA